MTKARRLVPPKEVTDLLNTLKEYGINPITVDVRQDGVTVSQLPPQQSVIMAGSSNPEPESSYDRWKRQRQQTA